MNNFNYFFTPVGPEYKKKFARNVGIAVLILFAFYGIMHLIGDISKHDETTESGIMPRYEKYLDENNELNFAQQYDNNGIIIDDLQRIHDWCDYAGEKPDSYFEWNNQTHHINSENCKWEENSDSSPIPDLVVNRDNVGNLSNQSCPVNQTYNQVLFKCVISCEDDLVYNGYTDSCTSEFELKYHGFCNDEFIYDPSSHTCYSNDGVFQIPLKDPPRTVPPEPSHEPFTVEISFEQTFQYEDLELYFYDIEDSRCPTDVTCIWEGQVTAMIHMKNQTHKISGYFTPNLTVNYITPYSVTMVDVQPHPISTEKPDYVVTLEIEKLE